VVTADKPLTLRIEPSSASQALFEFAASKLDQPVFLSVGTNAPVQLNFGPTSTTYGVNISLLNGATTIKYRSEYDSLDMASDELIRCLQTQMRIAMNLFWINSALAKSIAQHIARVSYGSGVGANLSYQATAIVQQLNAQACGPGLSYAPVLNLATYKSVLDGAISVSETFEAQYNRFTDKAATVTDMQSAWDTILAKAQDSFNLQQTLVNEASAKWANASDTLDRAEWSLRNHQFDVLVAKAKFQVGLEVWKTNKQVEAAFQILFAVGSKSIYQIYLLS
jgi:hypothetical protein